MISVLRIFNKDFQTKCKSKKCIKKEVKKSIKYKNDTQRINPIIEN